MPTGYYGSAKDSGSLSDSSASSDSSDASPFGLLRIAFDSVPVDRPLNIAVTFLGATAGPGFPGSTYILRSTETIGGSTVRQLVDVDLHQAWLDGHLFVAESVIIRADWAYESEVTSYASLQTTHLPQVGAFYTAEIFPGFDDPTSSYHGRVVVTPSGLLWFDTAPE